MSYYFGKKLRMPFDAAVESVTAGLAENGFGVLTTIDVGATLRKKLGVDFRRYVILSACNPAFAYKALQTEDKIGTMLPCNVIVQELGDGWVEVAAVDPVASMAAVRNPGLGAIAGEVRTLLSGVIADLRP